MIEVNCPGCGVTIDTQATPTVRCPNPACDVIFKRHSGEILGGKARQYEQSKLRCCEEAFDFIRWMTAKESDSDTDGWKISLHGGPDPYYADVVACPFCGKQLGLRTSE